MKEQLKEVDNSKYIEEDIKKVRKGIEEALIRQSLLEKKEQALLDVWARHNCPLEVGDVVFSKKGLPYVGKNIKILNIGGKSMSANDHSWYADIVVLEDDGSESKFRTRFCQQQYGNYLNGEEE